MENIHKCKRLGTMIDCSRNAVMLPEKVEQWIDLTADLGYNCLMLYTEDTYEVENEPYFGHLRGRYSCEELRRLDAYAMQKGMELIPCIQALAHLNTIFRWPDYQDVRDVSAILMVGEERTYELIDRMFATISKTFRSKIVNVGLDEAWLLGRGRYLNKNGYREQSDILLEHLNRISQIAKKYDLQLIMWDDMFFRAINNGNYYADDLEISEQVKAKIPENVSLIYWDYYSVDAEHYDKQLRTHMQVKEGMWFAGGLWSWCDFAPHNSFSIEAMGRAMKQCMKHGVENIFMTLWGDDGGECSRYAMLPSLYYISELAKGNEDMESIKRGFEAKYQIPFDEFMLLDLLGTPNEKHCEVVNPDKYMLYSDCFMGLFDSRVAPGQAESYAQCAQKLEKWTTHPQYGRLFLSLKALCDVMGIKYDLGVRTRNAYLSEDKGAIKCLIEEYALLMERLDYFYEVYTEQWMEENKPFGFEIQDLRMGGLSRRVKHCRDRLQAYVDGKLAHIEELEAPVLDIQGEQSVCGEALLYTGWTSIVSTNVL